MVWFNGMVWYGLTTRVELWPGVGNSNHSEFQRAIYPLSQAYSEAAASNLFPQFFLYFEFVLLFEENCLQGVCDRR